VHREEILDRLVTAGSVPLGCLTPEEMAVVGADDGIPFPQAGPPASLRGLPPDARRAVLAAALRGLMARGLLKPPDGAATPDRPSAVAPRDELDIILGVRRTPAAVVFVGRPPFLAALHGFREVRLTGTAPGISGFLEERVDQLGLHHFTVRTARNAVDALSALADPSGAAPAGPAPGDGAATDGPSAPQRELPESGPEVTTLDAYHSRPGGPRRIQVSLLIRPGEATATWSASGVEAEQSRRFAVTADGLRQVVREALCDPGGDPPGSAATTDWENRVTSPAGPPFQCPVCGYPGLNEPPRTEQSGPSYEICPSCGFEFGVTDDDRGHSYADWRQLWVEGGMQWWSRAHRKPPGWDPGTQLLTLLESGPGDDAE
jgi:hypothetical protein